MNVINWFPGHMHKARKELIGLLPEIDLIVEVLDARLPYSSSNPLLAEVDQKQERPKPRIKLLNKVDLADPKVTEQWLIHLRKVLHWRVEPVQAQSGLGKDKLLKLCHELVPERGSLDKPLRMVIMGIPNVGKSTVINALKGKAVAKTGNEAAVTRQQQKIELAPGTFMFDTPGMLWPKLENQNSAMRLAITGAIKDTAFEYEDVAFYATEFAINHYRQAFLAHYGLDVEGELDDHGIYELIEAIGRKRGCLRGGGQVDMAKVSRLIVQEMRAHAFGPLSFETPRMMLQEEEEVARQRELKAAKKAARKQARKRR